MSQDNDHSRAADAGDEPADRLQNTSLGVGISIGAGLGMVADLLFGDMLTGMIAGAGIGTLAGVMLEGLRQRRINRKLPPH
jgi:F0F1-type ATP synthase assembly protein I